VGDRIILGNLTSCFIKEGVEKERAAVEDVNLSKRACMIVSVYFLRTAATLVGLT
jgi:hypothetical protein